MERGIRGKRGARVPSAAPFGSGWPALLACGLWTAAGSLAAQAPTAPTLTGPESSMCAELLETSEDRRLGRAAPPTPSRAGGRPDRPASDLFCIELFSTPRARGASGVVQLTPPASPFGVSVTAQGHHRNLLTAWIRGLPEPAELGPYTTYVAWATPLVLDPVIKLGTVEAGVTALGEVTFNKYMILVTAEASPDVEERTGPLVLRGRSPSSLMEAHDMLARAPSAEQAAGMEMGAHEHGGAWEDPPMYPGVPMLAGMMSLQPDVSPLLPDGIALSDVPEVRPRQIVDLPDGGTLDLVADFARRRLQGQDVLMMAFNGQHPGPLIRVRQESTIFVNFENRIPLPTAIHWHGLRHDNRFDGVPGVTQDPVEPGETFRYTVHFPDAGIYWYHPHHREDVQQEMGLYGNMLVDAPDPDFYGPANQEEVLMLDDLLLGENGIVPFGDEAANYALMGRFGNMFLVNGEPSYTLDANQGDVVRFFLTNVSNTRTFNVSFQRAQEESADEGPPADADATSSDPLPIKVVASDVSRFEREVFTESVAIAPAERYVVDVRFPDAGRFALVNHVQGINHRMGLFLAERRELGIVEVSETATTADHSDAFAELRTHADVVDDIDRFRDRFDGPPDQELVLTLEVSDLPEPTEQSMLYDWVYFNPVEWTGTMPRMNWASSAQQLSWILRDPVSGAENMDIDWAFEVGDVVKIRVTNDRAAFHAMQHPLHIHGQRFLVLAQNGVPTDNLVWKDTVLLPTGSTTDILLDITNPGRWMVHCHIAEHLEAGMKFVFDVEDRR